MNSLQNSDYPPGTSTNRRGEYLWDGEYDEEANDDRPDSEKYTNAPVVVMIMFMIFITLCLFVGHVVCNIK